MTNPLKQGLKRHIWQQGNLLDCVVMTNPLKQGLKPTINQEIAQITAGRNDESTKTRIETTKWR